MYAFLSVIFFNSGRSVFLNSALTNSSAVSNFLALTANDSSSLGITLSGVTRSGSGSIGRIAGSGTTSLLGSTAGSTGIPCSASNSFPNSIISLDVFSIAALPSGVSAILSNSKSSAL
ncbi:MAG: hypothetical protein DDT42_01608 [candidate division WS2 bacterium]|uniref:Uncharacterized protein n=1 Tax=Psychracetigena formicireducens TaxID=2986056 RepID=A0A9E2BIT8_PSYF1|nr:hypothetical protein [Candidatus Psychracetigena formicireducens]